MLLKLNIFFRSPFYKFYDDYSNRGTASTVPLFVGSKEDEEALRKE